jgi:methylmalonyl-CoA mutase N-terminal domain/subunit
MSEEEERLSEIQRAQEEYEKLAAQVLSRYAQVPERETTFGQPLKTLYTPLDVAGSDYLRDLGFPGGYPLTRGVSPLGYRTKEWTRRQVVGLGTAEETNERLRYLFQEGQTGFSVCGMGYAPYESSDERSLGLLGRGGVWIDTLYDIETLFQGIDMERITINQIGESVAIFAMILSEARRRGIPFANLRGTIQNAVLPGGEGPEMRGNHGVDVIEYCCRHLPRWNHTSVSARDIREMGISAVQEIAFAIYLGVHTTKAALARGVDIDVFAPRVSFFLSAENEFLEEVAKYRAARRMWARLMRERFGAKDPRSWLMRFHVQTSAISLTAQQPLQNIIRSTIHALAAVLGGAQSMSVNSFDEVLAIPAEAAAILSLRTQQIILHETDGAAVVDPLGGSYCIEALTDQLEAEAGELLAKLEGMDGEKAWGYVWDEAHQAGYRRQQAIDRGERAVVGVNCYVMEEGQEQALGLDVGRVFEYDPSWRDKQIARLEKVKRERDAQRVEAAKKRLVDAYKARDNIIEPMMEAVQAYLSIGEIVELLAGVYGSDELEKRHGFYLNFLY